MPSSGHRAFNNAVFLLLLEVHVGDPVWATLPMYLVAFGKPHGPGDESPRCASLSSNFKFLPRAHPPLPVLMIPICLAVDSECCGCGACSDTGVSGWLQV